MFTLFNVFTIFSKAIAGCGDELLRLTLLLYVAGEHRQAGGGGIGWGLVNKRAFWLFNQSVGALDLGGSFSSNALSLNQHIVLL